MLSFHDLSRDVCILQSDVGTVNCLHHIYHVGNLPAGCTHGILSVSEVQALFINVLTSNHVIKLGTSTCHSILDW